MNRMLDWCLYYKGVDSSSSEFSRLTPEQKMFYDIEESVCGLDISDARTFLKKVTARVARFGIVDENMSERLFLKYLSENCNLPIVDRLCAAKKLVFSGKDYDYESEMKKIVGTDSNVSFDKPKGRTVFECTWDGYFSGFGGVYLFFDGRVFVVPSTLDLDLPKPLYLHKKTCKALADEVKTLIKENWENVQKFEYKYDPLVDGCFFDGGCQNYKFLSKRCGGYMFCAIESGKKVVEFVDKIEEIFKKYDLSLSNDC